MINELFGRILQMAIATMLKINRGSERLVQSIMDAIMDTALIFFGFSKKQIKFNIRYLKHKSQFRKLS